MPQHRRARVRSRREPDQPTDLPKESWPAILKRTFKQFGEDQLTTWAAALTYFGVLSLFPMMLALVSVLGVIGPSATQPLLDNLGSVAPGPAKDILTNVLTSLESNQGGSTVALIIGLAVAIWSASGYIGAFMDASNNVWDVPRAGRSGRRSRFASASPSCCSSCSRSPRWPSCSPARWRRRSATSSASAPRSSTSGASPSGRSCC